MVNITKTLEPAQFLQERKHNFELFVKEQSAKDKPVATDAALHNNGLRDSFGPVAFGKGLHNGLWILAETGNDNLVVYADQSEAKDYAKALQPILKKGGFPYSRVWVEEIAVRHSAGNPLSGLIAPTETFEKERRFIIRMRVLK